MWCEDNTTTIDVVTPFQGRKTPHWCPAGYFCLGGVHTPNSTADILNTPQLCTPGQLGSESSSNIDPATFITNV
jgi:hypothetical protein